MGSVQELVHLLEPSSVLLIVTAVMVVYTAAHRSFSHEREFEQCLDLRESSSITLDGSQALMIPVASSCSLLLMFYLFSSMSQLITAFTALTSISALAFWLAPYQRWLSSELGLWDQLGMAKYMWCITRAQAFLLLFSSGLVLLWLVSGNWILNNILGISICIGFVAHVRLPNVKICFLLLSCLFFYDIFWVFYSEIVFGANVMVTVATQQASNPVHTVANSLNLSNLQSLITKKLDLPVKLIFPKTLNSSSSSSSGREYMMLGLGDMAIPAMLVALVVNYEEKKNSEYKYKYRNKYKYVVYAMCGYTCGVVCALSSGLVFGLAQPALLYLVPSTLGPVMFLGWMRKEMNELWYGPPNSVINPKAMEA